MNIRRILTLCTAAIAAGIASTALGVDTIYGDWTANNITWTDGNGNSTAWVDGSIAYITALRNKEVNPSFTEIKPYKVIFDTETYRTGFWANRGYDDNGRAH